MRRTNPFAAANFVPGLTLPPLTEPVLWFVFARHKMLITTAKTTPLAPSLTALGLPETDLLYLGQLDDRHCVAAALPPDVEAPAGMCWQGLRRLYGLLPDDHFAIAGRAVQIVNWAQNHQYCGRCGTPTDPHPRERSRVCPQCRLHFYPRLSPAVIMLVEREGKVLLAHSPRHTQGMYSVLAGFVEPGESLEETVEREIFEEVGIRVKDIRYFGSQPWPFPDSLMLAFTCTYASGDITLDDEEIDHAEWFTPNNLPHIPPPLSISRQLIDWFVAKHTEKAVVANEAAA